MPSRYGLLLALALASFVACGGDQQARRCSPGAAVACSCPNGGTSTQRCADDGSGFGACGCAPGAGGGGGTGGAAGGGGGGGSPPPGPGDPAWALGFGDDLRQEATHLALAPGGDLVLGGNFAGVIDFGGVPLDAETSADTFDVFVARLDAQGGHVFSLAAGDFDDQRLMALAVDAQGNTYAAGQFYGTIDFGGGEKTSAGHADGFVAKLSPSGSHLWTRTFGGGYFDAVTAIALAPNGELLVAGSFMDSVTIGSTPLKAAGTFAFDIFYAVLDAAGTVKSVRRIGGTGSEEPRALAATAEGAVLAGIFEGTVDFDGIALTSADVADVFVAVLDRGAKITSARAFGGEQIQAPAAVAVAPDGAALLVGSFAGSIDFGGGPQASQGDDDAFVARLDATGAPAWTLLAGDRKAQSLAAVALAPSVDGVVGGRFGGTLDPFDPKRASAGPSDGVVVWLGLSNAQTHHVVQLGGRGEDAVAAVAVDPKSGDVFAAGFFEQSLTVAGSKLESKGGRDALLVKILAP
jgi:hypothetical protein